MRRGVGSPLPRSLRSPVQLQVVDFAVLVLRQCRSDLAEQRPDDQSRDDDQRQLAPVEVGLRQVLCHRSFFA